MKNMKIDGHAAGIQGDELNVYLTAGIKTDHEATNAQEAKERLALGMYLMIREGTVAKDLEALALRCNTRKFTTLFICHG